MQSVKGVLFKTNDGKTFGDRGSIGDAIRNEVGNIITRKSFKIACKIADFATEFSTVMPYKDVTGNLSESLGVAVVGSKSNRNTLSVGRYYAPAKRMAGVWGNRMRAKEPPLGKGEPFHGLKYPDGTPVTRQNLYRGETDAKKEYGRTQREEYIRELRNTPAHSKNTMYTVYLFAAADYANYVNTKHSFAITATFEDVLRDALAEGLI